MLPGVIRRADAARAGGPRVRAEILRVERCPRDDSQELSQLLLKVLCVHIVLIVVQNNPYLGLTTFIVFFIAAES